MGIERAWVRVLTRCIAPLVAATTMGAAQAATPVKIALTFDDLPAHSALPPGVSRIDVAGRLLAAFHDAGTGPVYGFVNGVHEEREPDSVGVLSLWRAAGHPLANHTWSHLDLNTHGLADWEADLVRNEALLQRHMAGQDWRWLRYPFLSEGETPEKHVAARKLLKAHGYRIASVTMSFGDYAWNEPHARCMVKGDAAAVASLEASYLKAAKDSLDYSRRLSATLYGRDIAYVLLMHAGAFDARVMPRLLKMYQDNGAKFVSLEEAERDKFYAADFKTQATEAPTTLENAMKAKGLPVPKLDLPFAELDRMCR
ncbi:peptidoglycan/xylan/chitin deacetylase (PgdA/CDA1 family) [Caulobacter rhizosphaerae]|uniref:Chitooligosaccharide deacetylase n=1 Tax=Caulobacter rhizosphaerae TaxID=2010972 RepID=A0ABU1N0N7_9CAUL|nr:polysaccharide deacetylase family protein [Caulobacter rhizosphaerae]MDR6531999.1 peptidoglycan/xylan/chitin deacetylase (PgdA/CDA1 family) [Caulobacter rhizosphaerae]